MKILIRKEKLLQKQPRYKIKFRFETILDHEKNNYCRTKAIIYRDYTYNNNSNETNLPVRDRNKLEHRFNRTRKTASKKCLLVLKKNPEFVQN